MDNNAPQKSLLSRQYVIFIFKFVLSALIIWVHLRFGSQIEESNLLPQFLRGLQAFLVPSIIFSIVRFIFITIYNARNGYRPVRGNFVLGINRLTTVANVLCASIALMIIFDVNPKEFITSITIVAMAIAVTFRDYITNMISGLIVMFSDQLSIGDRISVGGHKGRIIDITLANIILQDEEDDIVMVPNNMVFTSTLTNLSANPSSLFSVRFELPLYLGTELENLEQTLKESLNAHPNLRMEEELELKVVEIGKDFIKYKIDLHAVSYSNKLHRRLENEILKEVLKYEKIASKSISP